MCQIHLKFPANAPAMLTSSIHQKKKTVEDFFHFIDTLTALKPRYGARAPVTISGRVLAMTWSLVGLIITGITAGALTNSLALVVKLGEGKALSIHGSKVKMNSFLKKGKTVFVCYSSFLKTQDSSEPQTGIEPVTF